MINDTSGLKPVFRHHIAELSTHSSNRISQIDSNNLSLLDAATCYSLVHYQGIVLIVIIGNYCGTGEACKFFKIISVAANISLLLL